MSTVNVHEAKTHLSRLLKRVQSGEEIVLAKNGHPIARLVPMPGAIKRRVPGSARGLITIHDNFDDPLPDEILDEFYK